MSYNQSGVEKNDGGQLRKSGSRSGGRGSGGGGGGSSGGGFHQPSISTSRSLKKSGNGQGGLSRLVPTGVSSVTSASVAAPRTVQNGARGQPPSQASSSSTALAGPKYGDSSIPETSKNLPPPQFTGTGVTGSTTVGTPVKGDGTKPFALQFGTISPGIMNGLQIPARTSSAPPNLDEQKRDQARHDSFRAAPTQPPSGTKQPLHPAKKDAVAVNQSAAGEPHAPNQLKEAYQQISAAPVAPIPKSVSLPIPSISVPMQFQPPPIPLQFGSPAPQPMQMTLPIGHSPQVAPPMFVHNLQSHPFHTQAVIPQGQPLGFGPQMSHQLQLGNLGIGIPTSQFLQQQQQQPGKYSCHRKTAVKITHPETHEELRLDKNATSQSQQPITPLPPHYFPHLPTNSYNPSTLFFPVSSPVTTAPQPPRFSYPVGQSGPPMSFMNPSLLNPEPSRVMAPSVPTPGSVRPIVGPFIPKVGEPSVTISMPASKTEEPKLLKLPGEVLQSGNTGSVVVGADGKNKESIRRSDSFKDHQKMSNKDLRQSQQQTQEPVSEITTKQSSVNISKVGNGEDVKKRQLSKQIDLVHESLRRDAVLITYSLLTHDSEHTDVNSEARIGEVVEDNSLPAGSVSSRVGEEDQFDAPMSTGRILIKETESSEASSSSGAEMIENISKELDSGACQDDNTSVMVECGKELEGMEHGKSEEPEVLLESSTAKIHPVPISTESSEEVEPVGLVKQEENDSEKLMEADKAGNTGKKLHLSPHAITNNLETVVTSERTEKSGAYVSEVPKVGPFPSVTSVSKEKPSAESPKVKSITGKKKKRREILSKADAAGTSDLYNAYKGPEEKHQDAITLESADSSLMVNENNANTYKAVVAIEEDEQTKGDVDDWEDAAEVSTPKLENVEQANVGEATVKKYTRDFLLTLSDQTNLPVGFTIGSDLVDALLSSASPNNSHVVDPYPSPGKTTDRSPRNPWDERRVVGMMDDDRWIRQPGPFPVYDPRIDIIQNFRPGQQGVNYGVLRNIWGQAPILSGPMHSLVPQGGPLRNNSDADKWRSTNNSRGLMPPPRTPMQVMHKAERKYEVGIVSDEEHVKQRQLKGILNKLTPQNFEKLFLQVKEVNIDNTITLTGVISQIFDKALMEPTFCEMYANFCFHLSGVLPDFTENEEKVTFKRLLLNKCQEEFERGEREQAEANRVEEEGEIKQSEEEREEKRLKARRRMLGNIRLIGELYKKKMLTERIMHECIKKLLGQYENPDEEDLEALCKLMSTIGDQIDHAKAKEFMDAYFDAMQILSVNQKLSSRVRFMLRDIIDLRKNRWQQRRKVEGPKKIEEVHRDAAQERQSQVNRLIRGPSMNSSSRRGQPADYSSRGSSVLPSPSSQMGSIRGMPPQVRGFGIQDIRLEDRHPFENRMLSVPLPQRAIDDSSITLGPQGGLGRGMSIRGQPFMPIAVAEAPMSHGDNHRMASGPNGYSSRITERSLSTGRTHGSFGGSVSDTKPLSEDILREKSMSAIREFYSAKDEREMALCIKELNSPNFYPSMVSIWVTDSFERKDMERDLLASLLVNLCKSQDSFLNQIQLTQGFESVLSTLEDAVNDAPRAAEFLGRIFVKVVLEDVVPLGDIGKIIHEGGEEPGRLLEIGLASEVLGSILEIIRTEKGDSVLNEILTSSKLRLEEFRPPYPVKSKKLDAFL